MATRLPPDALEPVATLYAEVLFEIMTGLVKAKTVETGFGKIQQAAKKLTKDEMRRIAEIAGEYCANHSHSSGNVPKERWPSLKKRALEFALKTIADETQT
jgi:hypothetical protein